MLRHRQRTPRLDIFYGAINRQDSAVALGRGCNVNDRLCQWYPGLGPANEFGCLESGAGQHQCHRVGQTDVFGRMNDDPSRNEPWILARVNHFCQPVQSRVRIAAAHRFDKCRNRVVMRIFVIINDCFLLNTLLGGGQINVHDSVRGGLSGQGCDFQ